MSVSIDKIRELREKTGIGITECKSALEEVGGDMEKALDLLKKKGLAKAAKKSGRETSQGRVGGYIHFNGSVGVMLELSCETDFVAKNEKFCELLENIAMHIAIAAPQYVTPEEVPPEVVEREKNIYREQLLEQGKPADKIDRILEGKLNSFYEEICLNEQLFRDTKVKIKEMIAEHIHELGENIRVKRFVRYQLGE